MSNEQRAFYFRCQYQAGELIICDVVEQKKYFPCKMMLSLCMLAKKVGQQVGAKTGGGVAL